MTPAALLLAASVIGYVLQIGTGAPISKATVTLSPFNGGTSASYTATTSTDGRFSFQNINPGEYRLSATRNGFVRIEYGAGQPNRPGLPITVRDGQELTDIKLQMTPAGTIAGRVFDRDGEPLANVSVVALKNSYQGGMRALNAVETARTNDLGEYRLFWLQPGQYFVSATPEPNLEDVAYRGEGYIPAYYPGATDPQSATSINLQPGMVFTGVDMTVAAVPTLRIQGEAINGLTGQPVRSASIMRFPVRGTPVLRNRPIAPISVNEDGRFMLRDVVPGSYELIATSGEGKNRLRARVLVNVGNADVQSVSLLMVPGVTLTGSITIDGPSSGSAAQDLQQMRVMLRPDPITQSAESPPGSPVGPTGTFTFQDVAYDDYRLTVSGMPENAYVKLARYGGKNVLDEGLRIDRQPNERFEIVVSRNSGNVTGSVQNDKLEPSANVTVILIPDLPRRARLDLYRMATTDAMGRFHIEGVPPGDYRAFSWEDIETGAWQDPEFIRNFEDRGNPVRVNENGTSNIQLRVIRPQV